jgi:hypothetical protein
MHGSISTDDELLAGPRLRELSAGRVGNVEKGRARLRPAEAERVKDLLFEEMANRAREIAEYLPPADPPAAENGESSRAP